MDNKREGLGRHFTPDGFEYEGEWKNDKPNGKGKTKWPDGSMYEGKCWGGVKHVRLIDACVYLFTGSFNDNKREGFGRHFQPSGFEYEGEWKNDKRDGKGREKWPAGSTYEGECWGGLKHEGVHLIDSLVDLYIKGSGRTTSQMETARRSGRMARPTRVSVGWCKAWSRLVG